MEAWEARPIVYGGTFCAPHGGCRPTHGEDLLAESEVATHYAQASMVGAHLSSAWWAWWAWWVGWERRAQRADERR